MSGAVTALKLLESANPPRSIVMLEARELWYVTFVCLRVQTLTVLYSSGATGRNAGHCKPDQV